MQPNQTTSTWSAVNLKKLVTSMSSKLEPAIWSCDTGQQILCFGRCQLAIIWMSNNKEGCYKPRLDVSINLLAGVWLPSCATQLPSPSMTLCICTHKQYRCHNNHEKSNSWVSFLFLIWVLRM